MPIHDWTRVADGTWHDFHLAWIAEIRRRLNGGILPPDHYALAEQLVGRLGPDVLTLHAAEPEPPEPIEIDAGSGGIAVAVAPPRPKLVAEMEAGAYLSRRRAIVVRHSSDDRIVAMIEIVSPGGPRTVVAYSSARAYLEPTAVGRDLIEMPLFLTGETYVNVPLEETYRAAWEGVPRKWRAVLEATP